MANITGKIKTTWLKCMESIGQGAANMADNAKQKLGELNMENRRKDLLAELPNKVMQMWKDGVELPEELNGLLAELNGLEEVHHQPGGGPRGRPGREGYPEDGVRRARGCCHPGRL